MLGPGYYKLKLILEIKNWTLFWMRNRVWVNLKIRCSLSAGIILVMTPVFMRISSLFKLIKPTTSFLSIYYLMILLFLPIFIFFHPLSVIALNLQKSYSRYLYKLTLEYLLLLILKFLEYNTLLDLIYYHLGRIVQTY
jgi:hypothetical protein